MKLNGTYFYGNKISDYGIENGYLDYATLAKAFDAVLNNDIMNKTCDIGYWDQESGYIDNNEEIEEIEERIEELEEAITDIEERIEEETDAGRLHELKRDLEGTEEERDRLEAKKEELEEDQENQPEIYQYYIVDDNGARILEEINEIVFYNEELDMYIWGVTHWGTAWDYVLTDVPCNCEA